MAEIKLSDTSILYLRSVKLTIIPLAGAPKVITDLRIAFNCVKTNESKPNNAKVKVWNLSDNTRSGLESKGARVALEAGYIHNVATLFRGDVVKVVHKSQPPDIITEIEVKDGGNRFRNSRIDKGYPPGVKTQQVVQDLADKMELPTSSLIGVPNVEYANGLTLSGYVRDQLDMLAKKNNFEWSIQDETLQIIPKLSWSLDDFVKLTPQTGLIGSPSKTDKGVKFDSLLQPRLRPGRRVQVEGKFLKGIYKIRKVTHQGDSLDGDYLSKCEGT
jgi:hypothetical protein